jgi:hypothetical protein
MLLFNSYSFVLLWHFKLSVIVQPSSSLVARNAIATKVAAPSRSLALQRKVPKYNYERSLKLKRILISYIKTQNSLFFLPMRCIARKKYFFELKFITLKICFYLISIHN